MEHVAETQDQGAMNDLLHQLQAALQDTSLISVKEWRNTRGLRLGGIETRKRNQDKWAIGEVKSFSAIDFWGFGEGEKVSTFLFLPAFVLVLSGKPASQKTLFCFSCF